MDKQMLSAIENGNLALVKSLLRLNPESVRERFDEEDREQPLHIAAWQNRCKIGEFLIQAGADVNAKAQKNWTPLHYAAYHGSLNMVKLLAEHGAQLDEADEQGFTPAFLAIRNREPKAEAITDYLIANGAHVDINLAVCLNDEERVREILSADSQAVSTCRFPNDLVLDAVIAITCSLYDEIEDYPFMTDREEIESVIKAHQGILDILLEHGAPIDFPEFGWSPLFKTVKINTPYLTELLLQHGADVNNGKGIAEYDLWGFTRSSKCRKEMQALLLKYGYKRPSS